MPSTACRTALVVALAIALSACIVVPRTTQVYDEACQLQVRQMTLEAQQIAAFRGCANDGCLVLLAAAGVVSAASAVISGSIAIVGNIVYWAERQGRCVRPS